MKKVHESYPDDHEAAVFYALSLLASEPHHDETFANRKQAAAILEPLFASEPDHPGVAHYLIHAYDKPQLAQLGIPAARRYAQVAPAAPHALHMPSHIFARVGLWQDDINSNLASIAATRKSAAMHMGGEGHQFHAMDFLFYAYLQSGREADAKALMDEVKAMPEMHDMYGVGFDPHLATEANFAALYPLEMRDWTTAAALTPMAIPNTAADSTGYWAKAIGAAHLHQTDEVRKDVSAIESIHQKFVAEKKTRLRRRHRDRSEAGAGLAGIFRRQVRRGRRHAASHGRQGRSVGRRTARHPHARDDGRHAAGSEAPAASAGGISVGFEIQPQPFQWPLRRGPRGGSGGQTKRGERVLRAVAERLRRIELDPARTESREGITGKEMNFVRCHPKRNME